MKNCDQTGAVAQASCLCVSGLLEECFQKANKRVEQASGLWFLASRQKPWGVHCAWSLRIQEPPRAGAIRRDAGLNRPEAGSTILNRRPGTQCRLPRARAGILVFQKLTGKLPVPLP